VEDGSAESGLDATTIRNRTGVLARRDRRVKLQSSQLITASVISGRTFAAAAPPRPTWITRAGSSGLSPPRRRARARARVRKDGVPKCPRTRLTEIKCRPPALVYPIESPTVFKRDKLAPCSPGAHFRQNHRVPRQGCAFSEGSPLRRALLIARYPLARFGPPINHAHVDPRADLVSRARWSFVGRSLRKSNRRVRFPDEPRCQFLFPYPLTWLRLVFSRQLITTINLTVGNYVARRLHRLTS